METVHIKTGLARVSWYLSLIFPLYYPSIPFFIAKMWAPGPGGLSMYVDILDDFIYLQNRDICEQYRLKPDAAWPPN